MSENEQQEWWATGYDEMDSLPEGDAGDRVFLRPEEDRIFLFLDGDPDDREKFGRPAGAPFCIWEYQIPTIDEDGSVNWRNWATCVRGRKDADGNQMTDFVRVNAPDLKPYYVGFYTVLDITEVDAEKLVKAGKSLKQSFKQLLPAKRKLLKLLKRHSDKRNGLRGCVYNVFRTDKRAANTGDDWNYEYRLSEEELKKLLPDGADMPLEYHRLLAPLSEEEILGLLKHRTKVDRKGRGGDSDDDDRGRSGRRRRSSSRDDDDDRRGRRRSRRSRDDDDGPSPEDDVPF